MRMIRRLGCLLVAVLALMPVSARAAAGGELLSDGSFESPVVTVAGYQAFPVGARFGGWTVIGAPGNVSIDSRQYVSASGVRFPAADGNQDVDLTGTSNTATGLQQSVPTTPGATYQLSFEVGNVYDPGGNFGVRSSVDVRIDGRHVFTATNADRTGITQQVWQRFTLTFVASGSSTTVAFLNLDPANDATNGLDAVSLVAADSSTSSITSSLPTPAQAFGNPVVVVGSVALAAGGALFITFPSQLFNLTFEENYPAIAAWFRRRGRRLKPAGARGPQSFAPPPTPNDLAQPGCAAAIPAGPPIAPPPVTMTRRRRAGLPGFAIVVGVGALVGGLLDPRFGANATTAESIVAVVLALLLGVAVHGVIVGLFHRLRHHSAAWHYHALPLGLVVAVICVVVSRLSGFQPGYLYGVVAGIAFAGSLTPTEQGQAAGISVLGVMAVSVVAWLIWVPVHPLAEHPGAFAGLVVLDDFLGSVTVGGLVGSAIGMLPLRFLPGWTVLRWSAVAWALVFVLAGFAVVDILILSRPSEASNRAPLVTTVILFIVFSGGSVAFREYFARRTWARTGRTVEGFRAHLRELLSPRPPAG